MFFIKQNFCLKMIDLALMGLSLTKGVRLSQSNESMFKLSLSLSIYIYIYIYILTKIYDIHSFKLIKYINAIQIQNR